jgi:Na+(H+)/acetate symporter ActP
VNHIKIGVKIVVALVILVAAILGYNKARKNQPVPTGLAHAVGGMAFINILVATLWN